MTMRAHGHAIVAITMVLALALPAGNAGAAPLGFTAQVQSLSYLTGTYPSFAWRAGGLAMADFNGDGQMDAIVPGLYMAGVYVMLNGGSKSWLETGPWPVALAVADLDGDGYTDLAVCEQDGGGVAVYTNDGTGTLTRSAFYATGDTTKTVGPQAVLAVDVDKDGRLDMVVANRFAETVVVLHNTGSGFLLMQTVAVPGEPNALVAADLDNDGWLDVAVACASDDTVKILKNTTGALGLAGTFAGGPYPVAIAAADLNNDGYMDLAVADREAAQVTVLLNDGTGQFTSKDVPLTPVVPAFEPPVDVQLVDMNADGKIDIRCAGKTLLNDGAANFTTSQSSSWTGAVYAWALLAGRGYPLLGAAHNAGTVDVTYQAPPAPAAVTGDVTGDGHVDVTDLLMLSASWGRHVGQAGFVPASDLNRDGFVNVLDLLIEADNWGK